ncbi:TIC32, partial [Symbiodinium pilosum]
ESLTFNAFVECLCRLCFCHLNIYGTSLQQLAPSKQKMLWMLAMMEARLPPELGGRFSDDGDLIDASDSPRGPDSLWLRRDASFNISTCPQEDIVFFKTMGLTKLETKLGWERLMSCDVDDEPSSGYSPFRR